MMRIKAGDQGEEAKLEARRNGVEEEVRNFVSERDIIYYGGNV